MKRKNNTPFRLKVLRKILVLLLFPLISMGQNKNPEIGFKDYHTSSITDIQVSPDGNAIYTSDQDGKIIRWNAKTRDFQQIIKRANGLPVFNFHITGRKVIASQKYQLSPDPKSDSLVFISLNAPEDVLSSQLSFELLDMNKEGLLGVLINDTSHSPQKLFQVLDTNMIEVGRIPLWHPKNIAVSVKLKDIAFIDDYPNKQHITVVDFSSQKAVNSFNIPENLKAMKLFYDPVDDELFIITVRKDKHVIEIYNLSRTDPWHVPVYSADKDISSLSEFCIKKSGNKSIIASNKPNPYSEPLFLIKEGGKFASPDISFSRNKSFTKVEINPVRNEIYLVDNEVNKYADKKFNSQIAAVTVYNYVTEKATDSFPKINNGFYNASFLTNGSWLAAPNGMYEDFTDTDIKLFEKGTFEERYHNLGLKNYLEVHFNFSYLYDIHFIANTDGAVLYAQRKDEDDPGFYLYDFIKDDVEPIRSAKGLKNLQIQDYNEQNNLLLLSDQKYFNHGYTPGIKLNLVSETEVTDIPGDFKFGKFSNDGSLLLTISKENVLNIWDIPALKSIYTAGLPEGAYELFSMDNRGFAVTDMYRIIDISKCNNETLFLDFENKEQPKIQRNECMVLNSFDAKNGINAFIFNNNTLGIGNKTIPFNHEDKPARVSLNPDASRLMLSFLSGKITVYDTKTLEPLFSMIHPDGKSHIFWDYEHHYFSNVDANQFIYGKKNGMTVSLSEIDKEVFLPDKILEHFGATDADYLATLQKAMSLRSKALYTAVDEVNTKDKPKQPAGTEKTNQAKKPDLYLLSVGVSDYKDNAWSLTLPEKDATDMIRIYGKLDEQERKYYNDRFFGKKYLLTALNGETLGSINKFWDNGVSGLAGAEAYIINQTGTKWFFPGSEKSYLFDFEKNKTDTIAYKTGFGYSEKTVYICPDNTGFFLDEENGGFYSYSFAKKTFEPGNRPFEGTDTQIALLKNENWLGVNGWQVQIKNANGKLIHEFNPDNHVDIIAKRILKDGSIIPEELNSGLFPQFNGNSADGNLIFFSIPNGEDYDLVLLDWNKEKPEITILPVTVGYRSRVAVQENGTTFSTFIKDHKGEQIAVSQYNFSGKQLNRKELKDDSYTIFSKNLIAPSQTAVTFISILDPQLNKATFSQVENPADALEKFNPASFDTVHNLLLTNEKADSKSVKKAIQEFFKNARPNDQVMIFLAGHGVLDTQNNYFFAPHDMDFSDVSKNGVAFKDILRGLQSSKAKNKLLLMDACHSGQTLDLEPSVAQAGSIHGKEGERGAIASSAQKPEYKVSQVASTLFSNFMSTSGVTILSAASGGDLAQEHKDWGGGAFTQSFIRVLEAYLKRAQSSFGKEMDIAFSALTLDEEHAKKTVILSDDFIEDWFKEVIKITEGKQTPDLREENKSAKIELW